MCLLCPYEINRAKYPHYANAVNTRDQLHNAAMPRPPNISKHRKMYKKYPQSMTTFQEHFIMTGCYKGV